MRAKTNDKYKINIEEIEDARDRLAHYLALGFNEKALHDESSVIRLEAYSALGCTEVAEEDADWRIRMEAYQSLGFKEKAFEDECPSIRLEAYRALGYNEKALMDEWGEIREEAERVLEIKEKFNRTVALEECLKRALMDLGSLCEIMNGMNILLNSAAKDEDAHVEK